jgi:glycogen phosphorylase
MVDWRRLLEKAWPSLCFGRIGIESYVDRYEFEVEVTLGALDPDAIRVELFADPFGGAEAVRQAMTRVDGPTDSAVSTRFPCNK